MNGVIVYQGKYAATRQYAEWLGAALELPVLTAPNLNEKNLGMYDFVIIGSAVYMGKLLIRDWLKKYAGMLQDKKLFFFIVCATPSTENEKLQGIEKNNIPETIREQAAVYFVPGRMIFKKLSWLDRFMLTMGARLQKDPAEKKAMLQDFDEVKKENITALVNAVNAFKAQINDRR